MTVATAQVSVVVDASGQQVWDALTNPELIREYFFGTTVTTDWKVGSPITFAGEWKGRPYADKGEILVFRPNEELSYSHWSPMSGTDDVPESYHVVDIALAEARERHDGDADSIESQPAESPRPTERAARSTRRTGKRCWRG